MSFLGSNLVAVDVMLHLLLFVGSHSPSPFGGKFDNYFHGVKSGESLLQFSRNLCAAGDLRTCLISWLHHGRSMKLDCQRYLDIVPTSRPN